MIQLSLLFNTCTFHFFLYTRGRISVEPPTAVPPSYLSDEDGQFDVTLMDPRSEETRQLRTPAPASIPSKCRLVLS